MGKLLKWLAAVLVGAALMSPAGAASGKKVAFESGRFSLVGYLYHPEGAGPWPALLWNHGSEQNPGAGPQFDAIASVFVPAGYVVFAPERRGHGESESDYIVDRVKAVLKMQGKDQADRQTVRLPHRTTKAPVSAVPPECTSGRKTRRHFSRRIPASMTRWLDDRQSRRNRGDSRDDERTSHA